MFWGLVVTAILEKLRRAKSQYLELAGVGLVILSAVFLVASMVITWLERLF